MTREVILYTRKQCGLCDETADELERLRQQLGFTVVTFDIDEDAELREQYNDVVPVVAIGERVIVHAPVDAGELRAALVAALGS